MRFDFNGAFTCTWKNDLQRKSAMDRLQVGNSGQNSAWSSPSWTDDVTAAPTWDFTLIATNWDFVDLENDLLNWRVSLQTGSTKDPSVTTGANRISNSDVWLGSLRRASLYVTYTIYELDQHVNPTASWAGGSGLITFWLDTVSQVRLY